MLSIRSWNAKIAFAITRFQVQRIELVSNWCFFKDMSLRRTDQSFCLVEDDHGFKSTFASLNNSL